MLGKIFGYFTGQESTQDITVENVEVNNEVQTNEVLAEAPSREKVSESQNAKIEDVSKEEKINATIEQSLSQEPEYKALINECLLNGFGNLKKDEFSKTSFVKEFNGKSYQFNQKIEQVYDLYKECKSKGLNTEEVYKLLMEKKVDNGFVVTPSQATLFFYFDKEYPSFAKALVMYGGKGIIFDYANSADIKYKEDLYKAFWNELIIRDDYAFLALMLTTNPRTNFKSDLVFKDAPIKSIATFALFYSANAKINNEYLKNNWEKFSEGIRNTLVMYYHPALENDARRLEAEKDNFEFIKSKCDENQLSEEKIAKMKEHPVYVAISELKAAVLKQGFKKVVGSNFAIIFAGILNGKSYKTVKEEIKYNEVNNKKSIEEVTDLTRTILGKEEDNQIVLQKDVELANEKVASLKDNISNSEKSEKQNSVTQIEEAINKLEQSVRDFRVAAEEQSTQQQSVDKNTRCIIL
ncbi:MAG: hypothetical protein J0H68_09130 [Sphingobacteriia bacterium]|nr:hypothetical protein [Sphingobacteriia bacterium]